MTDLSILIFFFFVIFCFLTYSCTWFGRTLRNYQFEMARHAQAQTRAAASGDCRISVFTIERGSQRQTVINYDSNSTPQTQKDDLPPAYSEAIKMSLMSQHSQQPIISTPATQSNLPRRNSATI